jgi:hypothetical protein
MLDGRHAESTQLGDVTTSLRKAPEDATIRREMTALKIFRSGGADLPRRPPIGMIARCELLAPGSLTFCTDIVPSAMERAGCLRPDRRP